MIIIIVKFPYCCTMTRHLLVLFQLMLFGVWHSSRKISSSFKRKIYIRVLTNNSRLKSYDCSFTIKEYIDYKPYIFQFNFNFHVQ